MQSKQNQTHLKSNMLCIKKLLVRGAINSITPPINEYIETSKRSLLSKKGLIKLGWRSLRRLAPLVISNQKKHLLTTIDPQKHKKCLWLYYDAPQIGDALMDLAPRSLLYKLGIEIDLFTHAHIAQLFADDKFIHSVQSDPKLIQPEKYDFVIITNFTWKALKHKIIYTRHQPWISIYGEFTGPEINRALFSTKRLAELTKQKLSAKDQDLHAQQKLTFTTDTKKTPSPSKSVALAIGGVDKDRTFTNWDALIKELENIGIQDVILLGSTNGLTEANAIKSVSLKIHNFVGKTSLIECQNLMQKTTLIIAADGGLMHLATTTETPVIGLFNNTINPIWRLPKHLLKYAVQSQSRSVEDIEISNIINMAKKLI